MKTHANQHGHTQRHQHPLWVIIVFLAIALGALILILANNTSTDTGSGGTPGPDAAMSCPQGVPKGFELSDVEGKTFQEVETWANAKGWSVRVVMQDGQSFPQTMDYRPDRVNTQIESGVVTRYCGNY